MTELKEYDVRMVVHGKVRTRNGKSEAIKVGKNIILPPSFKVISSNVFDRKEVETGAQEDGEI